MTRTELQAAARNQGLAALAGIEAAVLETDGTITIIKDGSGEEPSTMNVIDRYPEQGDSS